MFDDSELIHLVEQFSFIYNKADPKFKNKLARENAWTTISSTLGDSPENVESRWTVLRNRYTKEKKKIKTVPTGSQGTGPEISTWPQFKEMGFLDKFIITRRTTGNINNAKCSSTASTNAWDTFSQLTSANDVGEVSDTQELQENDKENDDTQISTVINETENAPGNEENNIDDDRSIRRSETGSLRNEMKRQKIASKNSRSEMQSSIASALTHITSYLKADNEPAVNAEDELFAKSLACSLSQIKNRKRKSTCKIKLLEVLDEFEED